MQDRRFSEYLKTLLTPTRAFVFLLGVYLVLMFLFSVARLVFFLHFRDLLSTAGFLDILTAFAIGLRFDTNTVLWWLIPPLLLLPWVPRTWKIPWWISSLWFALIGGMLFLMLLGDIRFYEEFQSHLNFHVFDYLSEGKTGWTLVLSDPSFWGLALVWVGMMATLVTGLIWLVRRTETIPMRRSWLGTAIYVVLGLAVIAIGIRGRLSLAPIDWGMAYFSDVRLLNQMPLNGAYTLGRTLLEYDRDPRLAFTPEEDRWPFVPFDTALQTTQEMLKSEHEEWLNPDSTIRRVAHQPESSLGFRPNIVFVLMESFSGRNTSCLGGPKNVTPEFDSLADGGILFTNFYASGTRTGYGIAASICAFPAMPGRAILKRYDARHPYRSLSEILKERGYYNAFLYGGDPAFDNMAGFLTAEGYDRIIGEEDIGSGKSFTKWGVPDHVLFDTTGALLDSMPRPFKLTILTLSNHLPFALPDSSERVAAGNSRNAQLLNAQHYADEAIGRLMDSMVTRSVFDSTLFVFVADHAFWDNARYVLDPINLHIPLLLYGPGVIGDSTRRVETYSGQCDIVPTLMGILGGDYVHESWGRDILRLPPDDPGFAILNNYLTMGYLDPDVFYMEWLRHEPVLMSTPRLGEFDDDITREAPEKLARASRRLHHFLQTAEQLALPPAVERAR